jgi:hypothetical protein
MSEGPAVSPVWLSDEELDAAQARAQTAFTDAAARRADAATQLANAELQQERAWKTFTAYRDEAAKRARAVAPNRAV